MSPNALHPSPSTRVLAAIRAAILLAAITLAGTLAACGSSGKPDAAAATRDGDGSASSASRTDALPANASAEEVAAAARGDVDCPADVETPAPAAGSPVDDVVGVRPGMTWDEATNVVMCSNPLLVIAPETGRGFDIQTYGQTIRQGFSARFAEPRVEKTGRQIVQEMERNAMARTMNAVRHDMKPGQTKWFVATMGMPGQERVISAAREEWFAEGHNPTMDSVEQALIAKYGTPTWKMIDHDYRRLRWAYDPRGRLITETSPLFNRCSANADPDSGENVSADCGIVVAAMIQAPRDNLELSQFMQVGVVDQANGYAALTATTQGLQALDAQRRAQQVQEAAKNAQAPQL